MTATNSAEIPLRRRDGSVRAIAYVDAADLAAVGDHAWCVSAGGYAGRTVYESGGQRTVLLHRELMGLAPGDRREVDHVDRDPLNCRRKNLRVVSHAQNGQNRSAQRGARSKHRGVSWYGRYGKWSARVKLDGKHHFGGYFDDEEAAARAAAALREELLSHG